jgi:hypothetical protein
VSHPTSSRPLAQVRPSAGLEPGHELSAERPSPVAVSVDLSSHLPS